MWQPCCRGVGSRLDERPELLFVLRGVDETELVGADAARARDAVAAGALEPRATQGAAASKTADTMSRHATAPAASTAGPSGAPQSTGSATPSRRVKKTLTYRPPSPTAVVRHAAPTDPADAAAGFVPTGEMVAGLRERCRCSVAEFADLLQVTPTTVRRWEARRGRLNVHAAPWEALRALHREIRAHQG